MCNTFNLLAKYFYLYMIAMPGEEMDWQYSIHALSEVQEAVKKGCLL